jgi:hypothetical protein
LSSWNSLPPAREFLVEIGIENFLLAENFTRSIDKTPQESNMYEVRAFSRHPHPALYG